MTLPLVRSGPLLCAGAYALAMSAVAFAQITEAIDGTRGLLLMLVVSAVLLPLMARAALARAQDTGCGSPALMRYNRRFLAATSAYVLGLGVAVWLHKGIGGAPALLALLPALPTAAMVWAMARYLSEEHDEYLRYRALQGALGGLGLVLVLGSFWGFLETFGAVPHVWAWWVVPVWAVGMGLFHLVARVRGA